MRLNIFENINVLFMLAGNFSAKTNRLLIATLFNNFF